MDTKPQVAGMNSAEISENAYPMEANRREFLAGLAGAAMIAALGGPNAQAEGADRAVNVARRRTTT